MGFGGDESDGIIDWFVAVLVAGERVFGHERV